MTFREFGQKGEPKHHSGGKSHSAKNACKGGRFCIVAKNSGCAQAAEKPYVSYCHTCHADSSWGLKREDRYGYE